VSLIDQVNAKLSKVVPKLRSFGLTGWGPHPTSIKNLTTRP